MWKLLSILLGVTLVFVLFMRDIRMALGGERLSVPEVLARRRRRRVRQVRLGAVVFAGLVALSFPYYRGWMADQPPGLGRFLAALPLLMLALAVIVIWMAPRWVPDRWKREG